MITAMIGLPEVALGLLVLVFGLFGSMFWIWMLIECVELEPDRGNAKLAWILVLTLTHWVGALIYFVVQRPRREAAFERVPRRLSGERVRKGHCFSGGMS